MITKLEDIEWSISAFPRRWLDGGVETEQIYDQIAGVEQKTVI